VQGAEAESMKKQAAATAAKELAQKAKIEDAEKEKAILNAAHFTVGIGSPLKKELRDG
jgi:hypothetical protein